MMQDMLTNIGLPAGTAAERARSIALAVAVVLVALTGRAVVISAVGAHVFNNNGAAAILPNLALAFAAGALAVAAMAALHLKR